MVNETAMLNEVVNNQVMTLPGSIEQRGLIQAIQKVGLHSHLSKHFDHLQGGILVLDNSR